MIRHVVLLNWKGDVSQAHIDAVNKGFKALKSEIKEIAAYEFGPDAGIYQGNADYLLVAEFDSEADFKTYVTHPKHQAFLKEVTGPILDSFQSVQIVIDK